MKDLAIVATLPGRCGVFLLGEKTVYAIHAAKFIGIVGSFSAETHSLSGKPYEEGFLICVKALVLFQVCSGSGPMNDHKSSFICNYL